MLKITSHRRIRRNVLVPLGLVLVLGCGHRVHAADVPWNNTGTDFNDADSWDGNVPGTGDKALFAQEALTQPNLSSSLTIQGLIFGPSTVTTDTPTAVGSGYVLSSSDGAELTLTTGGTHSGARPIYQNTTGSNLITADLVLAASALLREFEVRSGTLAISGAISTVGDQNVGYGSQPDSILKLSGSNTFTGVFRHQGLGTLQIGHANALSTATLIFGYHGNFDGAFIENVSGAPLTLAGNNPIELVGGRGVNFIGEHSLNLGAGGVTLADPLAGRDSPIGVHGTRVIIGGSVGEGAMAHQLIKQGAGTLELQGAGTYTGATQVQGGVLLLSHADALGVGNLQLRQAASGTRGVLGLGVGDFTRSLGSGVGEVQFLGGGGLTAAGGFAAYGADRVVNLGGASATVTWNAGGFVAGVFVLGANDAEAMVDFQNPINLGASGASHRTFETLNGSAAIDGRLSGILSNNRGIIKIGAGTLELTAENTYTGSTLVEAGTLLIGGSGSINTSSSVSVTGGTFRYDSSVGLNRNVNLSGGSMFAYNSAADYSGMLAIGAGGGTIGGTNWHGSLSGLVVDDEVTLAPGNSIGAAVTVDQTWAGGGTYVLDLQNAVGDAGIDWDHLTLTGTLTLDGGLSQANPFVIKVVSLTGSGQAGLLAGFDAGSVYEWQIAAFTELTGVFNANHFVIDTSEFLNSHAGQFSLVRHGDTLSLQYIPEPGSLALVVAGAGLMLVRRRMA